MLDLEKVKHFYPFEPPEYFRTLAEGYTPDGLDLVSEEEMSAVAAATELEAACFDRLREVNAVISADDGLRTAARFLRYVLFEARKPWENYLGGVKLLRVEGVPDETVDLLFVTAALGYTLTVRKPPKENNLENINAYRGYTQGFTSSHGYYGISECSWNLLCAGGCMFMFNTLKFQPEGFCSDYLVITDGTRNVTLVKSALNVKSDGALTSDAAKAVFCTSYDETEAEFVGHEVTADGAVQREKKSYGKDVWRVALCGDDMVLGIHIPSDKPYTVEAHRESMRQAHEFYSAFYPDMCFKGFVCYSWLYSPQNNYLLPPDSRILEQQRHVHLCPMTGLLDENLMFIRKGSALQKRIADYRAAGNEWHVGYMYMTNKEAGVD